MEDRRYLGRDGQMHGRTLQEYRADYAVKRFEEEGVRFIRRDDNSDRFTVYSSDNGRKYTFYAGTGLIMGPMDDRGIENMIMIAKGSRDGLVQA